jgi:glutamine amidotransferase
MTIRVVDYGMGNLRSVEKALQKLGFAAEVTSCPDRILKADGLILPGVGAFPDAMERLEGLGLLGPLRRFADSGRPFLGVCLGLHLLFSRSEEFKEVRGLNLIPGRVRKLSAALKIPHMGWNQVSFSSRDRIFEGLSSGVYMYFVHSYIAEPDDPGVVAARTEYGESFPSVVRLGNIVATQFHPEKSQADGLRLLRNFGEWVSMKPRQRKDEEKRAVN